MGGVFGGFTNLIAKVRKAAALIRERRIVHNVPVKHIEFTVGHGILPTKIQGHDFFIITCFFISVTLREQ